MSRFTSFVYAAVGLIILSSPFISTTWVRKRRPLTSMTLARYPLRNFPTFLESRERLLPQLVGGGVAPGLAEGVLAPAVSTGTTSLPPVANSMSPGNALGGTPAPGGVPLQVSPVVAVRPVELESIDTEQKEINDEITKAEKLGDKLQAAVDMLSAVTGSHVRKGVQYSASVVEPVPRTEVAEEMTATDAAAHPTGIHSLYTAPILVLLPPEPTPVEKLEFVRATACLGKMNSPEMKDTRAAALAEMTTIQGTTIAEIEEEIDETKALLDNEKKNRAKVEENLKQTTENVASGLGSQADLLFIKQDMGLVEEKIAMVLDKLKRLDTELIRLREDEKNSSPTEEETQHSEAHSGEREGERRGTIEAEQDYGEEDNEVNDEDDVDANRDERVHIW